MTGGYLVLEKPNAGLVLSTNARFYAIVKPINEEVKPESWAWVCILFSFMCYWEVILLQHWGVFMLCETIVGLFVCLFCQKWTDVKLTSPQLSRESMYKLSLNHLTLQSVSARQDPRDFFRCAAYFFFYLDNIRFFFSYQDVSVRFHFTNISDGALTLFLFFLKNKQWFKKPLCRACDTVCYSCCSFGNREGQRIIAQTLIARQSSSPCFFF